MVCIAKELFPVRAVFPPLVTDASRSAGAAPNSAENVKTILPEARLAETDYKNVKTIAGVGHARAIYYAMTSLICAVNLQMADN